MAKTKSNMNVNVVNQLTKILAPCTVKYLGIPHRSIAKNLSNWEFTCAGVVFFFIFGDQGNNQKTWESEIYGRDILNWAQTEQSITSTD